MKRPTSPMRLLAFAAATVFILYSCQTAKETNPPPTLKANGFPDKIDSVYDYKARKVRSFQADEVSFLPVRLDAEGVKQLLADSNFTELTLVLETNSFQSADMFKFEGYTNSNPTKPVGLLYDSTKTPIVFSGSNAKFGVLRISRATIEYVLSGGKKAAKTGGAQKIASDGSISISYFPGTDQSLGFTISSGETDCQGNPSPPAPPADGPCVE